MPLQKTDLEVGLTRPGFQSAPPNETPSKNIPNTPAASPVNLSAMLQMMGPLNAMHTTDPEQRRRLIADIFRFVGNMLNGVPTELPPKQSIKLELSPRLQETLRHLLDGDSEKQWRFD